MLAQSFLLMGNVACCACFQAAAGLGQCAQSFTQGDTPPPPAAVIVPAGKDFVRLGADNARMTSQHETRKMLAYVAARMGGVEQLASRLGINGTTASHYVTGREVIPDAMVLRVVDLMLEGIPEEQT